MNWTMADKLGLSLGHRFCIGVGECKVVVGQRHWRLGSLEVSEPEISELEQSMGLGMSELELELELESGVP